MLIFDLVLLCILVWGFIAGLRSGIIVQLGGLAGLFLGVYFAWRFGTQVGLWLGMGENTAAIGGFFALLVAILIAVAIISRLMRGVFRLVGLGVIDKIGGAVISVVKVALVVSLLIYCFDRLNSGSKWVSEDELGRSHLYSPMLGVAHKAFPYIDAIKEILVPAQETAPKPETHEAEDEAGPEIQEEGIEDDDTITYTT